MFFYFSLPKSCENGQWANAHFTLLLASTQSQFFHLNSNETFALISSEAAPIKAWKFETNSRHITMQPLSTRHR